MKRPSADGLVPRAGDDATKVLHAEAQRNLDKTIEAIRDLDDRVSPSCGWRPSS